LRFAFLRSFILRISLAFFVLQTFAGAQLAVLRQLSVLALLALLRSRFSLVLRFCATLCAADFCRTQLGKLAVLELSFRTLLGQLLWATAFVLALVSRVARVRFSALRFSLVLGSLCAFFTRALCSPHPSRPSASCLEITIHRHNLILIFIVLDSLHR
jgi:hypothetical protein